MDLIAIVVVVVVFSFARALKGQQRNSSQRRLWDCYRTVEGDLLSALFMTRAYLPIISLMGVCSPGRDSMTVMHVYLYEYSNPDTVALYVFAGSFSFRSTFSAVRIIHIISCCQYPFWKKRTVRVVVKVRLRNIMFTETDVGILLLPNSHCI